MANDPNTIQYVIQEDGFWYIASKEKNPYVPELTVSAKGVANGLSTEYNDGYDFGPDSYNPSVTSGVPLTQTSGIQEAVSYGYTTGVNNIVLLSGAFLVQTPISIYKGIQLTGQGYGNGDNDFYRLTPPIGTDYSSITSGTWIVATKSMSAVLTSNGNLPAQVSIKNLRVESNYLSEYGINFSADTEFPNDAISGLSINYVAVSNSTVCNIDVSHNAGSNLSDLWLWSENTSADFVLGIYDIKNYCNNSAILWHNLHTYSPSGIQIACAMFVLSNSDVMSFDIIADYGFYYINDSYIANNFQNVTPSSRYIVEATIATLSIVNTYGVNTSSLPNLVEVKSGGSIGTLIIEDNRLQNYGGDTYILLNNGSVGSIFYTRNTVYVQGGVTGEWKGIPVNSPTISTNPPVTATVYQNTNAYDIRIYLPVYASTSGTAGTVAYGENTSSTVTEMTARYVNGATSSTAVDIVELVVPAGHYFEFTASGVTFGTAVVKAV